MKIERGDMGYRSLKVDGRYLYSPYDPFREIERSLEKETLPENPFFVLFGSAEGYVVEFLLSRGYRPQDIWCLEPVPELRREVSPPILEGDLALHLEEALLRGRRPFLFALEGYKRVFFREYEAFCQWYKDVLARAVENIKVTAFFSRLWWINYVRNMGVARQKTLYRLPHTGVLYEDVVVTASGPSLEASREELKAWFVRGGKILACLSSYAFLREAGIKPWGVVVSDAGVANVLHGVGIEKDSVVFASVYANSALVVSLDSPVVLYDYEREGKNPSFVLSHPSVVLDALWIAKRLFGGEVYVVGLDLAYSRQGTHPRANRLQQLARLSSHRLRTVETAALGFFSRPDLEEVKGKEGIWTTRAFDLVKTEVERSFADVKIVRPLLFWNNPSCEYLPLPHVAKKEIVWDPLEGVEDALFRAQEELDKSESPVYLRERMVGDSSERLKKMLTDKYRGLVF